MANERIILGIDPGTTIMGFGVIKIVGKNMHFMQLNELQLSKYDNHYQKLKIISPNFAKKLKRMKKLKQYSRI
mgnify:CR=1 FL=1